MLRKKKNIYIYIYIYIKKGPLGQYVKKFKATGIVTNLPGRGPMFILPPTHSEEDKRGKKILQGSVLDNYRGK